ncbi:MAG TPA: AI-2E family transporter [Gammaproteobacteria bacterium]|nr:MAG: AI-2E family transporter [OM182 bacterium]HAL41635.1 AI-2E family transporter [Gammaproteobacteria bacterium]|tara:strand:- start:5705 stop:6781 length:1077 start_codon:yes stop_codon:yes gene_type:complete
MNFLTIIGRWINRYFSQPDAVYLVLMLVAVGVVILTLGEALAPVLTGLVIAFLLQDLVRRLEAVRVPRLAAITVAMMVFLGAVMAMVLLVVPLVSSQVSSLVSLLPNLVVRLREGMLRLAEQFPEFVTQSQITAVVEQATRELGNLSGTLLENAFSQVFSLFGLLVYLILVPISVFFLLKDKDELMAFWRSILPQPRPLLSAVGTEMNVQLGNYVRGKAIEIVIVGLASFTVFLLFDLNYAALLGVLVGISVLIPFIGAAVVTFPVFAVAVLQFGWSWELGWIMAAYGLIQFLDGNVLVPLLFSEAVDLHPITIIISVLAFGGMAGLWGVFFAIPLATLIKAIYVAWPRQSEEAPPTG